MHLEELLVQIKRHILQHMSSDLQSVNTPQNKEVQFTCQRCQLSANLKKKLTMLGSSVLLFISEKKTVGKKCDLGPKH